MTDIIEIISMRRSGHHAIMAWLIENLTGVKLTTWDCRLTVMGNSRLAFINEANLNQKNAEELLKNLGYTPKTLLLNYEDECTDYTIFSPDNRFHGVMNSHSAWGVEPNNRYRFLVIRNFYNVISSRYHSNITEYHPFSYNQDFINKWKENTWSVVNGKIPHIKFEDWLTSKDMRNKFLRDNFFTSERVGIDNIKGMKSSFNESKNVLDRNNMVELPDEVKKMIRNDDELNFLIGALGYEYKKL